MLPGSIPLVASGWHKQEVVGLFVQDGSDRQEKLLLKTNKQNEILLGFEPLIAACICNTNHG